MVQAGGQKQTVSAGSPQTVTLNFGTASAGELVISAQGTGTVYIDDVKGVYWHYAGGTCTIWMERKAPVSRQYVP